MNALKLVQYFSLFEYTLYMNNISNKRTNNGMKQDMQTPSWK